MKKYIYLFVFALFAVSSCDKIMVIDEYNPELEEKKDDNEEGEGEDDTQTNDKGVTLEGIWKGNDDKKEYTHEINISEYNKDAEDSKKIEGTVRITKGNESVAFNATFKYKDSHSLTIKTTDKIEGNLVLPCDEITYSFSQFPENKQASVSCVERKSITFEKQ